MSEDYILIVDDEEQVHTLLKLILKSIPVDKRFAFHGKEALELVHQQIPRLIVLDLMMPIMDGDTTLGHLAADPATAGIPVMIFTAAAEHLLNRRWPEQVVEVVQKAGYKPAELRSKIERHIAL